MTLCSNVFEAAAVPGPARHTPATQTSPAISPRLRIAPATCTFPPWSVAPQNSRPTVGVADGSAAGAAFGVVVRRVPEQLRHRLHAGVVRDHGVEQVVRVLQDLRPAAAD